MTVMFILLVSGLLASSVDAAITGWSVPTIATPSGTGEVPTAIPESTGKGETVVTLAATTGEAVTAYAIIEQTTANLFTIANTGKLYITALLDFETTPSYVIKVTARDGTEKDADGALSTTPTATATITLQVGNVGPVFAQSTQTECVQQGSSGGTNITTLTATLDGQKAATYTITNKNVSPNDLFHIDDTSGKVTVATGKTLEDIIVYTLTIETTDDSNDKDTTELKIDVKAECSPQSSASMISPLRFLLLLLTLVVSFN